MILLGIGFILFVAGYAAAGNGEWAVVGLAVVIFLVIALMASIEKRDTRAWNNRQQYWADGGPNVDRRK